jgi:hypothetical protein
MLRAVSHVAQAARVRVRVRTRTALVRGCTGVRLKLRAVSDVAQAERVRTRTALVRGCTGVRLRLRAVSDGGACTLYTLKRSLPIWVHI